MATSLPVPENFARNVADVHGESGRQWLSDLPALLAECAERWSLVAVGPPFVPLSYNYVVSAERADGAKVVLKAGVPGRELRSEIEALRLFGGQGSVRLLAADPDGGALLLERIDPGTTLATDWEPAKDAAATAVAAAVMRGLWRPAPPEHTFPTVADWAGGLRKLRARFNGGSGPLPPDLVAEAEALFTELIGSSDTPMLLHGDLHHGNILAARRAPWLAIDPKGLVGDPGYEIAALLYNPAGLLAAPDPGRLLARRVDQLAEELGMDRARLRGWGVAGAVLSAWWSIEDHGAGGEEAIAVARLIK